MPFQVASPPGLVTGQRLTLEEFFRRWEDLPELKFAELIDGVVYLSSPLTTEHGNRDALMIWWLTHYAAATPGCRAGNNSSWLMLGSSPQPDAYLRILPTHGGQSRDEGLYCGGAPELITEICLTSAEVDFGSKLWLYQRAEVREYITVEILHRRVTWRLLDNGIYLAQQPDPDGVFRSRVFPGLWLDEAAFWAQDGGGMLVTLNAGLACEDHQRFVDRLARRLSVDS